MTIEIFVLFLSVVSLGATASARALLLKSDECLRHTCSSPMTVQCDFDPGSVAERDLSELISAMVARFTRFKVIYAFSLSRH